MASVASGSIFAADGPVPLTSQFASVKLSQSTMTLSPGLSTRITAIFTPPQGVDASTFPVFSGYIQITSGTESLQVSYMGAAAALKTKQVIDNTATEFGTAIPGILASGFFASNNANFTFVGSDFPTLLWRQAFGSQVILADLVSANANITTTLNKRGFHSPWFPHPSPGGSFSQVKTLGPLLEFDFLPRNNDVRETYPILSMCKS